MLNWNKKLLRAVNNSKLNGVKEAINHGADVNYWYQGALLIDAVLSKNVEIVEYLIKCGIKLDSSEHAIKWANEMKVPEIKECIVKQVRLQKLNHIGNG